MSQAPTMRDGKEAIREAIAMNHNRIAQERAFTIERIDRLQRFSRGDLFKQREREEWNAFNDRIHYLVRENDTMIQVLADLEATRAPKAIIVRLSTDAAASLTPSKRNRAVSGEELIARLEKLSGPDRAIDALILWWVNGTWSVMRAEERSQDLDRLRTQIAYAETEKMAVAPNFTASIDAALTLVPEGLTWQVTGRVKDEGYFADVDVTSRCESAPTPAIALCIAALRSRTSKDGGGDK